MLGGGEAFGGYQDRNTVRKIGKYQNTVSKIDKILIPHLFSVTLTKGVSISRFCLSQTLFYAPAINLSHYEET